MKGVAELVGRPHGALHAGPSRVEQLKCLLPKVTTYLALDDNGGRGAVAA